MQHVADGILHAYLDGALDALAEAGALPDGVTSNDVRAHFDLCADCRSRLEEARSVRERAGLILDDAGRTAVDVPPFDAIAGRAPARRRSAWLPLAWAASLLLAVGAGWWGSVLMQARQAPVVADAEAVRRTAPPPPLASSPLTETQQRPGDVASVESAAVAADEMDDADVGHVANAGGVVAENDRAEGAQRVLGEAAQRSLAESQRSLAQSSQRQGDAADLTGLGRAEAVPAPAPAGPAAAGLAAFRAQLSAARADESAWRRLTAGDVDTLRTVFVVADAGTAVFDALPPTPGMGRLVRVRQRLAGGDMIELMIGRPQLLVLDAIIVTGAADSALQRNAVQSLAARARESTAGAPVSDRPRQGEVVSSEVLADGLAEIVVRLPGTGTYIAIRGARSTAELAEIAGGLARPGR